MGDAAVRIARACGYEGAGTVEFLYEDGELLLPRDEHAPPGRAPGDRARHRPRPRRAAAAGRGGRAARRARRTRSPAGAGHAIECRVNAEDPAGGRFLPSPGTITKLRLPQGFGVRTDTGYESGDTVSQYYDNLVAKIIVWGDDREDARRRMLRALGDGRRGRRDDDPGHPGDPHP